MNAQASRDPVALTLARLIRCGLPWRAPCGPWPAVAPEQWAGIIDAARRHGVVGLLQRSARAAGAWDHFSASMRDDLLKACLKQAVYGMQIQGEVSALVRAFDAQSIPVLIIKGAALGPTLYDDPLDRPCHDMDLVIHPGQLAQACRLLEARRYTVEPRCILLSSPHDPRLPQLMTELLFIRREGAQGARGNFDVDLHWFFLQPAFFRQRLNDNWFWQHSMEIRINAQPVRTLSPEANLVFLCAHYAKHSLPKLIWSYDLALLLVRHGAHMDWAAVAGAASQGLILPIRAALEDVERIWQVSLPQQAQALLEQVSPAPEERACYFFSTSPRWFLSKPWGLLAVPGLANKVHTLFLHLFPSEAHMRARYAIRRRRQLPLLYAHRIVKGLARIFHPPSLEAQWTQI